MMRHTPRVQYGAQGVIFLTSPLFVCYTEPGKTYDKIFAKGTNAI